MFKPARPDDAYLRALLDGKRVIATAVRERKTTPRSGGVVEPLRWWFMVVLSFSG
jgi:hypothetical protein